MMTDEQKKLVESNHSLIYFVIHNMNLPVEEYYDLAAIGLCKAAMTYDSEKKAFSTYACMCMKNEILKDHRSRNMKKRIINENLVSYDEIIFSADEEKKTTLLECIKSDVSVENEALSRVMHEELMEQLGKTDSKMIKFFKLGLKQREIASIMGVTQANVSRVKRRLEKILCCN